MGFWKALGEDLKNAKDSLKEKYEYSSLKREVDKAKEAVKDKVKEQVGYAKAGWNQPGTQILTTTVKSIAAKATEKALPNVSKHISEESNTYGFKFMNLGSEDIAKELVLKNDDEVSDIFVVLMTKHNPRVDDILESFVKLAPAREMPVYELIAKKMP